ncbi:MAG TPA: hypothetical protein VKX46_18745 [Ktedonobacteraceae bacterium]|nr:hypothetical protein [Ktedonobacteraceae bacterium]
MSQEYTTGTASKKARRSRHQRAGRPTLVTTQELEQAETTTESLGTEASPAPETTLVEGPVPAAKRPSRLPNFFSRVDKSEQEVPTQEPDVMQARLARATRKRGSAEAPAASAEPSTTTAAPAPTKPAAAKPAQPNRLFKTRHITGMAIYLLAAEFILPYEVVFARNLGIEQQFAKFPIFGFQASLTTSFFLNILTLLLLLWLLVRLDMLPTGRNMQNQSQGKGRTSNTRNGQSTPTVKQAPPTIRQGVQGANDDLYLAYRSKQRREKKR